MLPGFDNIATGLTSEAARRIRDVHEFIESYASKDAPVKSQRIENYFSIQGATVRGAISFLRTKGYPIASDSRGYWVARVGGELDVTIQHIEARAQKLLDVVDGLKQAQRNLNEACDEKTQLRLFNE